jgi:hypothetical protein
MMRHAIDVMHVEKNVCEALIGTLLDIPSKTKDTLKAQMDLEKMKLGKNLHHKTLENGSKKLPTTCLLVFSASTRTGWLKSRVPILRWSYELQSTL